MFNFVILVHVCFIYAGTRDKAKKINIIKQTLSCIILNDVKQRSLRDDAIRGLGRSGERSFLVSIRFERDL